MPTAGGARTNPNVGGERSRGNPNSGVRETTIPNNNPNPGINPNNNRPPTNTNRDRGGPRNDQPTFRCTAPKTETRGNPPSGQSSRNAGGEGGGNPSESGKKKGRDKQ